MNIILIGDSGHAKVIADMAESNGDSIIARLDDKHEVSFYEEECRIGPVSEVFSLIKKYDAKVTISIGSNKIRKKVVERLSLDINQYATVIHKNAVVSPSAEIGSGTVIMPGAILNAEAKIGNHAIINTRAIIEHECKIEDYVHISPGAVLTGGVIVKEGAHLGASATIIPLKTVGRWCAIGAGSVVIEDIEEDATAVGVPARIVKEKK